MESARNFITSSPSFASRTVFKASSSSNSSACSVLAFHEQAAAAATSFPIASVARHFPTSVLLPEQRDEYRPLSNFFKDDKLCQGEKGQMESNGSFPEEKPSSNFCQLSSVYQLQFLEQPGLRKALRSFEVGEDSCTSATQLTERDTENFTDVDPAHVIALAKKALWASKEAILLDEDLKLCESDFDDGLSPGLVPVKGLLSVSLSHQLSCFRDLYYHFHSSDSANYSTSPLEEEVRVVVRSTRLLERRSKRRRVPKLGAVGYETHSLTKNAVKRKVNEGFDPNDPLRFFLWGPETKELLTAKQESELILKLQEITRLEDVKTKLQSQFGREPTFGELAEAVGLSCQALQSELHSGNAAREKLITANLRMVVHIAKQYQGRGLSFQDLLLEGSLGLLKSVQRFKPQADCRFSTYAYWWIRQTIRKAVIQRSRTIRLPENVFCELAKVREAKRLYAQEGNHKPSKEELARRVGMPVTKLENLLFNTRMPISMQQPVWSDQDITFQEATPDPSIETPDVSVAKQLMRRHVCHLLNFLKPRERRIIKLRFGFGGVKQNSLSEIGEMFGMTKERVRQLESRALYKLKQHLSTQGLSAYTDLLL